MDSTAQEHLNSLRIRVEDSAGHFLYFGFERGAKILEDHLVKKMGLPTLDAKKIVAVFHLHFAYYYQEWLDSDAYNRQLRHEKGEDLDDEFREITLGGYKWTSTPPTNFDINKRCPIPSVIEDYMDEIAAAKKGTRDE